MNKESDRRSWLRLPQVVGAAGNSAQTDVPGAFRKTANLAPKTAPARPFKVVFCYFTFAFTCLILIQLVSTTCWMSNLNKQKCQFILQL
jgi:hypothetical protein